jgi:hypothetical protein
LPVQAALSLGLTDTGKEDLMFEECCVECGHLLSQKRNLCPFCGWSLQGDQYLDQLEPDYQSGHLSVEDIGVDRLPDVGDFQRIGL